MQRVTLCQAVPGCHLAGEHLLAAPGRVRARHRPVAAAQLVSLLLAEEHDLATASAPARGQYHSETRDLAHL